MLVYNLFSVVLLFISCWYVWVGFFGVCYIVAAVLFWVLIVCGCCCWLIVLGWFLSWLVVFSGGVAYSIVRCLFTLLRGC